MTESDKKRTGLAWGSLSILLTLVCLRVTSDYTPFPWWDSDPFVSGVPVTGLTPTWSLAVNYLIIAASVGVVWGVRRIGGRMMLIPGLCIAAAEAVVLIHAMRDLNTLIAGTDLIASACAGYACWHATQLPRGRAVIAGITLGLVFVLSVIGAHQMFVQHAQTVAMFETNKESILASRGWAPGSYQALSFERRLMQPEPTAWFGLSNVYASLAGAMAIGLGVLAWRERRSKLVPIYFGGALLGGAMVVLSRSTGAMGAMCITIVMVCLCALMRKIRLGMLTIFASTGVIGAVIARGFIGEWIGELSILFRSQYIAGATRIWGEHPIIGVGSGNFQSNYARLKPPTSPEDVSSPHSIAFDFISTLGLGGIALLAVFVVMAWSISPRKAGNEIGIAKPDSRTLLRAIGFVVVISSVFSIRLATGTIDLELMGVQALGVVGWGVVAILIATRVGDASVRWAMGSAAAVLFVHGQLDLAPTFAVSAALFSVMIGGAGQIRASQNQPSNHKTRKADFVLWTVICALTLTLIGYLFPIARWESHLQRSGRTAFAVATLSQNNPTDPQRASLEQSARDSAVGELLLAFNVLETHTPTRVALNELIMSLGIDALNRGEPNHAFQLWETASDIAHTGLDYPDAQSADLRWAGTLNWARWEYFPDSPQRETWGKNGVVLWTRASRLTPHDPNLAVMIMDGYIALGEPEQARFWAQKALEINVRMHLDPLRQFDAKTRLRIEQISKQ